MSQIVAQAEAEREQEVKAIRRAELLGRVRSVFVWLFLATILIFAYNFHDKLTDVMDVVMPAKKSNILAASTMGGSATSKEPTGQAAVALRGAAQNAAVRDNLIEALSSNGK